MLIPVLVSCGHRCKESHRQLDRRPRVLALRRFATVEPVFGNIRHNKRLNRFSLGGRRKIDGQWKRYCLVHNTEKLAKAGYGVANR